MFIGYVLAAVRSTDPRGGLRCGDTPWHGVPGARLVSREPYTHLTLGAKPPPDLLVDAARILGRPGLETCVVSQVVADSLARLPLEGCRDTRRVHGGKWRERV